MKITKEMELFLAVSRDRVDAVDALLTAGANPNLSLTPDEYIYCLCRLGLSGMRGAPTHPTLAEVRDYEDYEYVVGQYAPEKKTGYYPLSRALDRPDLIKSLLAAGADPDILDGIGTILHSLAHGSLYDGSALSAKYLLEAGADVDYPNSLGDTPLIRACLLKADGGFIEELLAHGASVHARDHAGNTALHAAGMWDEGYVPWPLDNYREFGQPVPEDYDAPDTENKYHYRTHAWGAREAVNALVDAGAGTNSINPQNGYTPMHWASVHHGQPYLCFLEALFERGGRGDIRNHASLRPMDFPLFDDPRYAQLSKGFAAAGEQ